MQVVLDPEAATELREAAVFYEECREGLGKEFLEAVEIALAQVSAHPTLWRVMKGRFRRYLIHRFPDGLIYSIEGQTVFVAALMHLKRKPSYWVLRDRPK